jgi:phosphatidylserine decarboxylase
VKSTRVSNKSKTLAPRLGIGTERDSEPSVRERLHAQWRRLLVQEDINFLLTNRIPRIALTRLMGRFSKVQNPFVCRLSMRVWALFANLDLSDAKKSTFGSLHDCFTRELKDGARAIDTRSDRLVSPSDGIVGACGAIEGTTVVQAKGFPYTLADLLQSAELAERYRDGVYVTLRLTSTMYHRFHAPAACRIRHVTYISGDTWNVNPIALKRIERLFCKNERAVIHADLPDATGTLLLVPVAAVLVASIRLHFLNVLLHLSYRGANEIACDAQFQKGQELGWFEHGSTIIVLAPRGYALAPDVVSGKHMRMGESLLQLPVENGKRGA